ncbi:hypothetical protein MBLNU457_4548t2 [Dothideomycetes sp. NU457]
MSRTQQDQFIDDDEEETCPLCVEEFDLGDKHFRPCPCGYQICQFCYNNVRNNMNGLCPACRRPYDDSSIDFKKPSADEEAAWKAKQAARQKKSVAAQQKELQKKEADTLSRKHLAGLRVVQKNLVYVTGLSPSTQEDKLLETLRGPQYFGQYGKIVKIVVSKAKDHSHPSSVGVYVTYARKEDAASCIEAVDGSENGERILRAQFGTTKYCSAYIRGEPCQNRNCMFLHEPGEERDSFTRQDLSSMNVISTQQPSQTMMTSTSQPPPQTQQPVAAAHSTVQASTPLDPNAPALPSTASWASKPAQQSRAASRAAMDSSASPAPSIATPSEPAVPEVVNPPSSSAPVTSTDTVQSTQAQPTENVSLTPNIQQRPARSPFVTFLDALKTPPGNLVFSGSMFSQQDLDFIKSFPPLFDANGGAKRRVLRIREEEERRRLEQEERTAMQAVAAVDTDDQMEGSGSRQLGGEPEDLEDISAQQHAIQPPSQHGGLGLDTGFGLDNDFSNLSLSARGLTPQQQQQLLLQQFKASPDSSGLSGSMTPPQQGAQFSNPMGQSQQPGHARNTSRYTFANDSSSASAAVKPVANPKLMNQQASMMPPQGSAAFGQQQGFYTSTVSGPPPGLKTTGTPPVSGGGMFGQGHGFATSGLGYGANVTGRNSNDDMMRELLRRRDFGGQDAGKREYISPSFSHASTGSVSASTSAPGILNFPFHAQQNAFQDAGNPKAKKKGKKHKQANTSSSGGGVVDVADPSILQARIHPSNAAGGQGLHGGQSQGALHSMMYGGGSSSSNGGGAGFGRW